MKKYLVVLWLSSLGLMAASPQGHVVGWGMNGFGAVTGGPGDGDYVAGVVKIGGRVLSNVVSVATGGYKSFALKSDGTVANWGYTPDNFSGWSNITAISASWTHLLALTGDGTVMTSTSWPELEAPKGLTNIVAIAAGMAQTVVITKDGGVVAWGKAGPGGMPNPPPPTAQSNVVAFALCQSQYGDNLALKRNGTVMEWPSRGIKDEMTMPAGLSNVTAVACGNAHCLALKADGTVVAWGLSEFYMETPNYGQADVPVGLSNVVAIAAGGNTSLALKSDGTVVSWGGIGPRFPSPLPVGLSNVAAIAVDGAYCLAIQTKGTVTETNVPSAARMGTGANP
jgi:alpha-tubulin suppressor-like RCC1 family protein